MPGAVDKIDNFGLVAWACSDDGAAPAPIRVEANGEPLEVFFPKEYRSDLAAAGWARGNCSVRADFRRPIALFEPADVRVINESSNELLFRGTLPPAVDAPDKFRFIRPLTAGASAPTTATLERGRAIVRGLSAFNSSGPLKCRRISGTGEVESFSFKLHSQTPLRHIGLNEFEFELVVTHSAFDYFSVFEVAPEGFRSDTPWASFVSVPSRGFSPEEQPELGSMQRVSGPHVSPDVFLTAGLTTATKLAALAEQFGGGPLRERAAILDWGAGAGRVSRHISKYFAPGVELWCADVDLPNVTSSQKQFPNGRWLHIPFYPPTNLPAKHFDFVYGISVLTHLTEAAQEVWLAELKRVTRPGAILALSANTELAAATFASTQSDFIGDLLCFGIADRALDGILGPKIGRANYYRSTYHLSEYIAREWGKYFTVLKIVHGADVHVQDLVILQNE